MADFNTTGADKLDNYERLSPTFSVFTPIDTDYQPNKINLTAPTYSSNDYDFSNIDKAENTPTPYINSQITDDTKEDPAKPMSAMDKFREIFNRKPSAPVIKASSGSLRDSIAKVESNGGNYKAYNPNGGGEGAVGKYQFRWTSWKPSITKITGINNKEDFMNNPQAQEDFFDYYHKTTLIPQLQTIRKEFPNNTKSDNEIMELLHFRGLGNTDKGTGVRGLFSNGNLDKRQESYNLSANEYLANANK